MMSSFSPNSFVRIEKRFAVKIQAKKCIKREMFQITSFCALFWKCQHACFQYMDACFFNFL